MKRKRYKVGDKVTIRNDLSAEKFYDGCIVRESMEKLRGKTCTIKIASGNSYRLEEDKEWYWASEMFSQGKPNPEDLTRYMVYGDRCDNKSDLVMTEKELKAKIRRLANNEAWTGRLIGYKLVPLFETKKTIVLKVFKLVKLK